MKFKKKKNFFNFKIKITRLKKLNKNKNFHNFYFTII
jgi:hypothetical protein